MSPATLRVVLLVSCAHALVHIYELSLPSVEELIGEEFGVGTTTTGRLGTAWRIPFGFGALLAGWLADRFGSKPLLVVYLAGCVATSALTWWSPGLGLLFVTMFAMGAFASIYHPAGLALISRRTTPLTRGQALGWHGILGSIGIAGAPFLAGVALAQGFVTWRGYYLLLMVPGAVLAGCLVLFLRGEERRPPAPAGSSPPPDGEDDYHAAAYFVLVTAGTLSGFVYAALMNFLPRYLGGIELTGWSENPASTRNLLAGVVLLFGVAGQWLAGRLCRPGRLEALLALIFLANAPCLVWMSLAEGRWRLGATCVLMFVHFMNQPVYNSLIAQYVPRARRSVSYGFSNMLVFGLGALGPAFAGAVLDWGGPSRGVLWTYQILALLALLAGLLALVLCSLSRR